MNWFKIEVNKGTEGMYHYVGCCAQDLEQLAEMAARGDYIRLNQLLYMDRGDLTSWEEWDRSFVPSVAINPKNIVSMMQFKGDPRATPRK